MEVSEANCSMGGGSRGKQKRVDSPGPGAYKDRYKVTKKSGPSYGMGVKTKSNYEYLKQSPGPAAYKLSGMGGGKGWSFGGKLA